MIRVWCPIHLAWLQVYEIKHSGMQTFVKEWAILRSSVNSCVNSILIECHLCYKFSCEIFSFIRIPQSTISFIIRKWTLGTTAQPYWSGRPHKLTEKDIMQRCHRIELIATEPQTSCDLQINPNTVCRVLHGMGFHGQKATPKSCIKC